MVFSSLVFVKNFTEPILCRAVQPARCSFPVAVRGNWVTKATARGYL